jgi:hypothetical protein
MADCKLTIVRSTSSGSAISDTETVVTRTDSGYSTKPGTPVPKRTTAWLRASQQRSPTRGVLHWQVLNAKQSGNNHWTVLRAERIYNYLESHYKTRAFLTAVFRFIFLAVMVV